MEHDAIEGPVNAVLLLIPHQHIVTLMCAQVSPVAATNLEYTRAIGTAMSRPTILPTPGFAFRLLLGEERAKMLTEGQHVVPQRLLDVLHVNCCFVVSHSAADRVPAPLS